MIELKNEDFRKIRHKMDEIDLLKSLLVVEECNLSLNQKDIYNKLINSYITSKNDEIISLKLLIFKSYGMPKDSIFIEIDNKTFIK
ncbi:MAG: hypothetical protein LBK63_01575 [Treponema sp.]|jgi:uncharacterized protein YfbU (UPF0304 family)|nr:hypothetical protein [Treponema sp.]